MQVPGPLDSSSGKAELPPGRGRHGPGRGGAQSSSASNSGCISPTYGQEPGPWQLSSVELWEPHLQGSRETGTRLGAGVGGGLAQAGPRGPQPAGGLGEAWLRLGGRQQPAGAVARPALCVKHGAADPAWCQPGPPPQCPPQTPDGDRAPGASVPSASRPCSPRSEHLCPRSAAPGGRPHTQVQTKGPEWRGPRAQPPAAPAGCAGSPTPTQGTVAMSPAQSPPLTEPRPLLTLPLPALPRTQAAAGLLPARSRAPAAQTCSAPAPGRPRRGRGPAISS